MVRPKVIRKQRSRSKLDGGLPKSRKSFGDRIFVTIFNSKICNNILWPSDLNSTVYPTNIVGKSSAIMK
jgi:hypothetical protein